MSDDASAADTLRDSNVESLAAVGDFCAATSDDGDDGASTPTLALLLPLDIRDATLTRVKPSDGIQCISSDTQASIATGMSTLPSDRRLAPPSSRNSGGRTCAGVNFRTSPGRPTTSAAWRN